MEVGRPPAVDKDGKPTDQVVSIIKVTGEEGLMNAREKLQS
jgi:hypothetical protein